MYPFLTTELNFNKISSKIYYLLDIDKKKLILR